MCSGLPVAEAKSRDMKKTDEGRRLQRADAAPVHFAAAAAAAAAVKQQQQRQGII